MQLVPCSAPDAQLTPAPLTALCAPGPGEQWSGYWSVPSDDYFARCVLPTGQSLWYHMQDSVPAEQRAPGMARARRRSAGA